MKGIKMKRRFLFLAGLMTVAGITHAHAWQQPMMMAQPQQPMMMVSPMSVQAQQPMTAQQAQAMARAGQLNQQMPRNQQFIPQNQIAQMPSAAHPSRMTGALPQVGSNVGRSPLSRHYYMPQTFDRLADSGLYIGLSAAFTASIGGGMQAEYRNKQDAWFVPGSFRESTFRSDTVMPLQISVGAAINSDVRIDFSYTRISGIAYSATAPTSNGMGGFLDIPVTGGSITSAATMLNVFYNIDSFTGQFAGGSLRPYVGVGVGIATNTISDYLMFDGHFYAEVDESDLAFLPPGIPTGVSDIFAYHAGGTRENLAFMIEAGVTTQMDSGVLIDFFVRYMHLGRVQSSGSVVVSQTDWLSDGAGGEFMVDIPSVQHYTGWRESGNLSTVDIGVRLRLQF